MSKIPFVKQSNKKNESNNVEKKHDKAMELVEHGISFEAVKALDQLADIGTMQVEYQQYGVEALKILGQVYETGKYEKIAVKPDPEKAAKYYERYINLVEDGEMMCKLGLLMLDLQEFTSAVSYLEKAADYNVSQAYMHLGEIYEHGLNQTDAEGNKSDYVIAPDINKAKLWYKNLADKGDDRAKAALDRLEYTESHSDNVVFEEMDKIYSDIAERRKAKGIEFHYKAQDAADFAASGTVYFVDGLGNKVAYAVTATS